MQCCRWTDCLWPNADDTHTVVASVEIRNTSYPLPSTVSHHCLLPLLRSSPLCRGPAADKANEELFVISTERAQEEAAPLQSGRPWRQLNAVHSGDITPSNDVQRGGRRRKRASAREAAEGVNMCVSDSESSESREPSLAQFKRSRLGRKALHKARRGQALGTGFGVEQERRRGVWDAGDCPSKEDEEEHIFLQMTGKNKPKVKSDG